MSATTASGRVQGRPTGPGTFTRSRTATNRRLSPACPGVSTNASGRQRRSAARWILLVGPPRECPSPAAFKRARCRRRTRQRSARAERCTVRPAAVVPPRRPRFGRGSRFQGRQLLGVQGHPGSVVVRPCCRRVHAAQAQVRLALGSGLGNHRLHQVLEDSLCRPDPEAVVRTLPGPELAGKVAPGAARAEPPHHRVEVFPQVGDGSACGDRKVGLIQGPLRVGEIASRHD